jgi:hypothetical protein
MRNTFIIIHLVGTKFGLSPLLRYRQAFKLPLKGGGNG